jgi:hypothetical protein
VTVSRYQEEKRLSSIPYMSTQFTAATDRISGEVIRIDGAL